MEENLTQKSIGYALQCNWKLAIKTNLEILKNDPDDIDALNRLAKSYFENGDTSKAISTSKKVLKINPDNNIAKNSLVKFQQSKPSKGQHSKIDVVSFIEVPGRTKITTLINLCSEKVYSCLNAGDEVFFITHAHKISVVNHEKKYIGKLTDDLSARLRVLIKAGYKYHVLVKSVTINCVRIFIEGDKISFPRDKSEPQSELSS